MIEGERGGGRRQIVPCFCRVRKDERLRKKDWEGGRERRETEGGWGKKGKGGVHSLPLSLVISVRSGQLRNVESARVSVPGQVIK